MNAREINKKLKKLWDEGKAPPNTKVKFKIVSGFTSVKKRGRPCKSINTYEPSFDFLKKGEI